MTTNNNENKNTTITVLDTAQAFRELLTAPVTDRPDLVRRMWEPMAGMFRFFPGGAQAVDIAETDRYSVSFDWSGNTAASYVDRIDHAIDLMADVFAAELYGEVGYTHFIDPVALEDGDGTGPGRTEEIFTTVTDALDTTGMQNFTAWIHGDASARLFGVDPVGVPTGAGLCGRCPDRPELPGGAGDHGGPERANPSRPHHRGGDEGRRGTVGR